MAKIIVLNTCGTSAMQYDASGNRLGVPYASQPAVQSPYSLTYTYDGRDELLSEAVTLTGSNYSSHSFAYDVAGNFTTLRSAAATTTNSSNELSGTGYTYDNAGNPTTFGSTALTFDAEDRMTAYGSTTLTAGYREDGLRAWKQNSAGTRTYFLYDDLTGTPICELNSSGTVTATNTFGPLGLLFRNTGIAITTCSSAGSR